MNNYVPNLCELQQNSYTRRFLGQEINFHIHNENLNRVALSTKKNIPLATLLKAEKGKLSLQQLLQIARTIGVSSEDINTALSKKPRSLRQILRDKYDSVKCYIHTAGTVARNARRARRKLQLTVSQVAMLAQVPLRYVLMLEYGISIGATKFFRIMCVLQVSGVKMIDGVKVKIPTST